MKSILTLLALPTMLAACNAFPRLDDAVVSAHMIERYVSQGDWQDTACPNPKVQDVKAAIALGLEKFENKRQLSKASLVHGIWIVTDRWEEAVITITQCEGRVIDALEIIS